MIPTDHFKAEVRKILDWETMIGTTEQGEVVWKLHEILKLVDSIWPGEELIEEALYRRKRDIGLEVGK